MTLRVVGAGLGRTGTHSLKLALEQLLGRPLLPHERAHRARGRHRGMGSGGPRRRGRLGRRSCRSSRPRSTGRRARSGSRSPRRRPMPSCCSRCASRPRHGGRASSGRSPRRSRRMCRPTTRRGSTAGEMVISMIERTFTPDWPDRDAAIAAYERHNQHVRDTVPAGTAGRVAARRRLGADLRGARPRDPRRAVPAHEHHAPSSASTAAWNRRTHRGTIRPMERR